MHSSLFNSSSSCLSERAPHFAFTCVARTALHSRIRRVPHTSSSSFSPNQLQAPHPQANNNNEGRHARRQRKVRPACRQRSRARDPPGAAPQAHEAARRAHGQQLVPPRAARSHVLPRVRIASCQRWILAIVTSFALTDATCLAAASTDTRQRTTWPPPRRRSRYGLVLDGSAMGPLAGLTPCPCLFADPNC